MDEEIRPKALMIPFDKFVILDILPPEQYKNTMTKMRDYVEHGKEPEGLEPLEQMAFESLRPFMDENIKTYKRSVLAHREAGRRGGRPKKPIDNQEEPNGFSENQMGTNCAPKYKVQSTKYTSDTNVSESIGAADASPAPAKSSRFHPPDVVEVKAYFAEKGGTDEQAERFCAYYESNGWKVGRNPMKNWKAAASGWISRDKEQQKAKAVPRNKAFMASRPPEEAAKAEDMFKNITLESSLNRLKKKGANA